MGKKAFLCAIIIAAGLCIPLRVQFLLLWRKIKETPPKGVQGWVNPPSGVGEFPLGARYRGKILKMVRYAICEYECEK